MTTDAKAGIHPVELLDQGLFETLVGRLHKDHPELPIELCGRIQRQALEFLDACAKSPGTSITPSVMVDLGWHNFILHTKNYFKFCEALAGGYIHHNPYGGGQTDSGILERTQELIGSAGHTIDAELWALNNADCNSDSGTVCGSHF
jgi:hypothetical protein